MILSVLMICHFMHVCHVAINKKIEYNLFFVEYYKNGIYKDGPKDFRATRADLLY